MRIVRSKIFESPDGIEADNLYAITGESDLGFYGRRAVPFGYYEDKMRVGKQDETHGDITKRYNDMPDHIGRFDFKYGGRLWPFEKVISFWNYPSPKEFQKVLKDIQEENSKKYGDSNYIDFKDPNWSIEVITKKLPNSGEVVQEWDAAESGKLIPFSEYAGSEDQSVEAQAKAHVASPMNKLKRPDQSAYFKERSKKERPLAWKQALVKSESLVAESLDEKLLMGEPVSVPELRDILHNKILNFEFIKLDGEVRPAKGTTMMKYVPQEEQPTGDNPSSDKVAAFYDLDKNAWRSVSNRSKEIVLDKDEETGKPKIVISDKEPKTQDPAKKLIPKEKDVEQRPLTPKVEPIVQPSIRPATPTRTIQPDFEVEPEETTPLDIQDPTISADDVQDDQVIVTTNEPEDIEPTPEPAKPTIPMEPKEKPIVKPTITSDVPLSGPQPETLPDSEFKLPPKEEITFPDEDEDEES